MIQIRGQQIKLILLETMGLLNAQNEKFQLRGILGFLLLKVGGVDFGETTRLKRVIMLSRDLLRHNYVKFFLKSQFKLLNSEPNI